MPNRPNGEAINAVRESLGWSYEALARVLGVDRKTAYAMCLRCEETGRHVGKATAEQLALVQACARRRAA